jgi:hypothetical protein
MSRQATPWRLNLPPANVAAEPRNVEEAFRRIEDYLAPYGGGAPHLELLARFLGGHWFEGTVSASVDATIAGDTVFTHNLNRVPGLVILSAPTDGSAGRVRGLPAGGAGATGVNVGAWTNTAISVRADVTGSYQFIVL